MTRITHTQFSTQASYMASEAASWAADVLTLPEDHNKPMSDWALERFLDGMRARLSRVEAWVNEPISTPQPNVDEGDGK